MKKDFYGPKRNMMLELLYIHEKYEFCESIDTLATEDPDAFREGFQVKDRGISWL